MADARARRSILGRLSWGVVDQGVSSLQNFVLGIFVARSLGVVALGALGIAFVAYSVVLSGQRGLSTDPLVVRFSGPRDRRWVRGTASATGTAAALGSIAGLLCVGIGVVSWSAFARPEVGAALVALGVTLPGLMLQDSWRFAFFASGQGAKAFANDVVWTVLMVAGLVTLEIVDASSVGWCVLAFGGSAYVAAVLGSLQAGSVPDPRRVRSWLAAHRDLGVRFLAENLALGVGGQVRPAVVTAADGVRATGGVRGAEMLMGPVVTMLMGVAQVAVPETVRGAARGRAALRRICVLVSLTLAAAAGAWAVVVLVVFPHGGGTLLLGEVWAEAYALFPAVAVSATAGCLHVGPSAGLRALGRADRTLRCQLVATGLFVVFAIVGAVLAGAQGAIWGMAAASLIAAWTWWSAFLQAEAAHFASGGTPRADRGGPRIVIASLMRERGGTGVQTHVSTLLAHLRTGSGDATLVTPFSNRSLLVAPVFAARLALRPLTKTGAVWWYRHWHGEFLAAPLRSALRAHPDAVVYAQCPVSAAIALRVRRPGQPVVLAAHFNVSQADEWADKGELRRGGRYFRAIRAFEHGVIPRLDGIVYVSEFARRIVEQRVPAARGVARIVVPNPVVVPPEPPARETARHGDLVTVGALEPRKNQHYLLQVLHELALRGARPSLTVVGDGPDRAALERRAKDLGLSAQVRFVGYSDDVTRILAEHRVYCHAARMESFGIAVAEAMAAGLPVVAAPVGGVADLVEAGRTGEFWPLDDPAEAADVLARVLSSGPNAMGTAGWAAARDRFAAPAVCDRIACFLAQVRSHGSAPTRLEARAGRG